MPDVNPYVAPQYDLPLNAVGDELGDGVWRDGDLLMMRKDAVLPDRCFKCNGPASGRRLKVRLRWNEPIRVLGVRLPSLTDHSAKIEVSLCSEHRRKRRIAAASSGLFCLLGIAATFALISLTIARAVPPSQQPVWPMALMIVSLVAAVAIEVCSASPVRPQKIDEVHVWLNKVDPRYLDQFSPFPG